MRPLPIEIYSVATVREIDRTAIEDEGIPGYTLMTRAGAAAVRAARERFPDATRWQVVCGAGNNAGDGYVVARLAAQEGFVVSVIALVDPESLSGDAALEAWTRSESFSCIGVQSGCISSSWAQRPATSGVAKEVPLYLPQPY